MDPPSPPQNPLEQMEVLIQDSYDQVPSSPEDSEDSPPMATGDSSVSNGEVSVNLMEGCFTTSDLPNVPNVSCLNDENSALPTRDVPVPALDEESESKLDGIEPLLKEDTALPSTEKPQPAPAASSTYESTVDLTPKSTAGVVPESAAPALKTSAAPTAETTAAPTTETTASPIAETTAASTAETTAASTAETTAASTAETTAASTAETTAASTAETTAASTAETTAASTAETTAAPTVETTAAPTVETTAAPTVETSAKPETSAAPETAISTAETTAASETATPAAETTNAPESTAILIAETTSAPETTADPVLELADPELKSSNSQKLLVITNTDKPVSSKESNETIQHLDKREQNSKERKLSSRESDTKVKTGDENDCPERESSGSNNMTCEDPDASHAAKVFKPDDTAVVPEILQTSPESSQCSKDSGAGDPADDKMDVLMKRMSSDPKQIESPKSDPGAPSTESEESNASNEDSDGTLAKPKKRIVPIRLGSISSKRAEESKHSTLETAETDLGKPDEPSASGTAFSPELPSHETEGKADVTNFKESPIPGLFGSLNVEVVAETPVKDTLKTDINEDFDEIAKGKSHKRSASSEVERDNSKKSKDGEVENAHLVEERIETNGESSVSGLSKNIQNVES